MTFQCHSQISFHVQFCKDFAGLFCCSPKSLLCAQKLLRMIYERLGSRVGWMESFFFDFPWDWFWIGTQWVFSSFGCRVKAKLLFTNNLKLQWWRCLCDKGITKISWHSLVSSSSNAESFRYLKSHLRRGISMLWQEFLCPIYSSFGCYSGACSIQSIQGIGEKKRKCRKAYRVTN